jgi:hypothetical protein
MVASVKLRSWSSYRRNASSDARTSSGWTWSSSKTRGNGSIEHLVERLDRLIVPSRVRIVVCEEHAGVDEDTHP